ncbi:hypothetical protein [Umezakia ovalisporum]|uniref:Uncharacterized protein n=1 Tax=Umezakia ovalisporum FSS-43 TaxID=2740520 RepID=A0ABT6K1I3_9CYAN|nr:hypothetical protein [Umezakia ovalisporum]MDH6056156.1 hypothetical protein [Umezakia ovalisporum FSS-43]
MQAKLITNSPLTTSFVVATQSIETGVKLLTNRRSSSVESCGSKANLLEV